MNIFISTPFIKLLDNSVVNEKSFSHNFQSVDLKARNEATEKYYIW